MIDDAKQLKKYLITNNVKYRLLSSGYVNSVFTIRAWIRVKGNKKIIEELLSIGFKTGIKRKIPDPSSTWYAGSRRTYSNYEMEVLMEKEIN